MGEISLVLIILLVEALLVAGLAGLAYVYHARLRRRARGVTAAVPALLSRAAAATETALRSRGGLPDGDPREETALRLRLQVLELEQSLADPARRGDDDYWASVCAGYGALAGIAPPGAASEATEPACRPEADCEEEARELTRLLEAQRQTLDRLSAALAGLIEDPDAHWSQEAEIQSLREDNRRIGQGLEILTDESRFLAQRLDQLEGGTEQSPPVAAAGG